MSPDEVRGRLAAILAVRLPPELHTCRHCHGTGKVTSRTGKVATQADVARVVGVGRTQIANFLIRRTDLSFPVGLRLIEWIEGQESELAAKLRATRP